MLGGAALSTAGQVIGGNQQADAITGAANSANALQRYIYDQNRADQAPWTNIGAQAIGMLGSVYGFDPTSNPYAQPAQGQQQPQQFNALSRFGRTEDVIGGVGPGGGQQGPAQPGGGMNPGNFEAFFNSPDYQFTRDQGLQALDRSAASRGRLYSGSQMNAAQQFGQGLASQQYGNWFNRLSSLAGAGQSATNQVGQYGQNYANQAGQNYLTAGGAQASAYGNRANALGGFIGDAAYGYGRGMFGGGGGGGGGGNFGLTGNDYAGPWSP